MYHLRNESGKEELPFHSGPVHLKYLFKTLQLAQNFVTVQLPQCQWESSGSARLHDRICRITQIRGGFFYVLTEVV
jgi:hypothetical protein